jgi:hypothetical protein
MYNQMNEEIAETMGSISIGQPVDEDELQEELEALQQQELEGKMLETGAVPVDRLPAVANGEGEWYLPGFVCKSVALGKESADLVLSQRKSTRRGGHGRRRGSRAQEVAGRDGHVIRAASCAVLLLSFCRDVLWHADAGSAFWCGSLAL